MVNLRTVDLNLLVVLDALIAERSATRAGARLGLTQSAVSAALARLRHLFGDQLLVPTRRGLEPTGRALEIASTLGGLLDEARHLIDGDAPFAPATLRRDFRIAMSDYAALLILPKLTAQIGREAPGVSFTVTDRVSGRNAGELLESRAVDCAITVAPRTTDTIATQDLLRDTFLVCARCDHSIWSTPLSPEALAYWPALLVSPEGDRFGIGDRLLSELGLQRRVMLTLSQFLTAPAILEASDLVAILPRRVVEADRSGKLRSAPLPFEEQPWFELSMAWHRRDDTDPALAWLRTMISSAVKG
jgi:DNA-binding transcriptional LysR family regulator